MTPKPCTLTAKKNNSPGKVTVNVALKCHGTYSDSARITASTDLTTGQARELAADLVRLADAADAKVAAKAAEDARRKAYCDRDVAARRMIMRR
jgi:hypothetical protein